MTDYNLKILESGLVVQKELPTHPTKKWSLRDPSKIQGVCFHQSMEEYGTAMGNARYHVGPNHISPEGLPGLSYTIFVEKGGTVVLANPVEAKTFSQGSPDTNELYLAVCFGGNFSGTGYRGTQTPTGAQLRAAEDVWGLLSSLWGWDGTHLFGHYHFGKPACPGFMLSDYIDRVRPQDFESVAEKQNALRRAGFLTEGFISGVWDLVCKNALYEFQRYACLKVDGVWGPATSSKMKEILESKP